MTKAAWKKCVLSGLVQELESHMDSGAEWLFLDANGEPLTPGEEARMREAVKELQDEFERRGRGWRTPNVRT